MPRKTLGDINSLKEFERIPNPELIDPDDLMLIEDEKGELRSVKYKDVISGVLSELDDYTQGPTGPQGPKGEPGVEIVEEFEEPDPDSIIWVKEGISPQEDLSNNIDSYLNEIIKVGEGDPRENADIDDKTMIYFQVDDTLPSSNIKIIKVPNNESDFQKQLDKLRQQLDLLTSEYVQVYQEDTDEGTITDDNKKDE